MPSSTGVRAGKAYVEVFADDSRLVRGLRASERRVRMFGVKIQAIGTQMMAFGTMAALPLAGAAKAFADFEQQMANVSTMLDDPDKWMPNYSKEIKKMAKDYGESTEALAGGLYDILSASIPAEQAISVLDVAVRAAKAGMTDTATSADAITTMLNSYGLSADRAADVSDLLFKVVKRGKTTFAELAPSIGMVASVAASANVPLEELGAGLAVMTRSGVRTERAITAMNAIIMSFLKPTDEAAALAKKFGVELNSATIKTEGLQGAFAKIASLPPDIIANIFPNVRAIRGIVPALKNMTGFVEDLGQMKNRAGAADAAFKKMTATLMFQLNKIKQQFIAVFRAAGQALAPSIIAVGKAIGKAADATTAWIGRHRGLVTAVGLTVAAILTMGATMLLTGVLIKALAFSLGFLGKAIVVLKVTVKAFVLTMKILGKSLLLFTSPIGVVVAAVIGLGVAWLIVSGNMAKAIGWLSKKFGSLKDDMVKTFGGIGDALAAGDLSLAMKILWLMLKMEWAKGINGLKVLWFNFKSWMVDRWYDLVAGAQTAMHGIEVAWIETVSFLKKTWTTFSKWHALAVQSTAGAMAKAWEWAKNKMSGGTEEDLQFRMNYIDKDVNDAIDKINKEFDDKLAGLETQREGQRAESKALHEGTLAAIEQEAQAKLGEMRKEFNVKNAANMTELEKAKQEWQAALDEARQKRAALDTGDGKAPEGGGIQGKINDALAALGGGVGAVKKGSVSGTFNAFAAAGMGTGNAMDRTAKATEQTAKNTENLLQEARFGGLKFT